LSDIPVVRELIPPSLLSTITFDPYDYYAMAEKMEWALENREGLLQQEDVLYQEMKKRTWYHVIQEYLDVFQKVIRESKQVDQVVNFETGEAV
jgi:hypothetical protein